MQTPRWPVSQVVSTQPILCPDDLAVTPNGRPRPLGSLLPQGPAEDQDDDGQAERGDIRI